MAKKVPKTIFKQQLKFSLRTYFFIPLKPAAMHLLLPQVLNAKIPSLKLIIYLVGLG
jgi:hypothetical protein